MASKVWSGQKTCLFSPEPRRDNLFQCQERKLTNVRNKLEMDNEKNNQTS